MRSRIFSRNMASTQTLLGPNQFTVNRPAASRSCLPLKSEHAALLRSGARVHVAVHGPDVLHVLRVDRFAARRVRERFDLDQAVKKGFGKVWKVDRKKFK